MDDFRTVRERVDEQVPGLVLGGVPRRFAICEIAEDFQVFCWGVEMPGGALAFLADGHPMVVARSGAQVARRFAMVREVELVWLD